MAAAEGDALPLVRLPDTMTDAYYDAYCVAAHMRLSSREHARTWWSLGVSAEEAGAWARQGFTPEQGWYAMNAPPRA